MKACRADQRSDPLLFAHDYKKRYPADVSDKPQSLAEWTEFHEAVHRLPNAELEVIGAVFYGGVTRRCQGVCENSRAKRQL